MNERRQPLGGVKKETYVHAANNDPILSAQLTYDLIVGIKSDLCHEIKQIQCQPEVCVKKFVKVGHVKVAGIIILSSLFIGGVIRLAVWLKIVPFL